MSRSIVGASPRRVRCRRELMLVLVALLMLAAPGAAGAQTPDPALPALTEYPAGGTGPNGITVGPDLRLWYSLAGGGIGAIDPTTGAVQTYPTTVGTGTAAAPQDITLGPDGNLWFTSYEGLLTGESTIGRITPTGTVDLFSISQSGGPGFITAAGGNLYFTRKSPSDPLAIPPLVGTGAIGLVDLSSPATPTVNDTFVELAPPSPFQLETDPTGIVPGPGGDLWFGSTNATGQNSIGRVPTAGGAPAIEAVLGPIADPYGVVAGATEVFFAEEGTRTIGRTAGGGSSTPVGTTTYAPQRLALDGQTLWITEYNEVGDLASGIGKLTLAGTYTQWVQRPVGSGPDGITIGPDGMVWVAETGSNKIVRIHPNKQPPPPPPVCSDGLDNDFDGRIDFPADPGCSSAGDTSEAPDPPPPPPGGGSTSGGSTGGGSTSGGSTSGGSTSGGSKSTTSQPQACTVPKLRGLTVKKAKKKLRSAKCKYRFRGKGRVVRSNPKAGKRTTKRVVVTAKAKPKATRSGKGIRR